ncbi:hypothetical protein [Pinibacter soli]|uniref:Lipoprotein n=1 Tax=Pinibacter soli TaxID=3044211 RepID=A0ABT6R992_9BACT|nr:hypothetical protein [Pinibacter soli]MDI3319120.1 hypothetical protein [Pinibacter soli]
MLKITIAIIAFLALIVALCSCKTVTPIITTKIDSTIRVITVKETLHDTTLIVQADSASITALLECDSAGNVLLKQLLQYSQGNRIAPPKISLKNNVLKALSVTDSAKIYLAVKELIETDHTTEKTSEVKFVPVKENYITRWQWFQIYLGRIFGLFIAGYLIGVILKNRLALLSLFSKKTV